MGVYISGMDIPKNCLECTFYRKEDPIYDYCCISYATPQGYIPSDCPLVEIPPHGDLIDRGELLKCKQHYGYLSDEYYITVRDIEEAPTILEAEEDE